MAKLILSDVGSLVNHESARETINNNFTEIEQAVDELLSRDGTTPNQMTADLDMNSKKVMNMADGVADADGVNIRVARRIAADAGSGDTSIRQDLAQVGTGKGTELVAYTPPSTGVLGTVKGFLDSLWSTGASAGAALIRWIQTGTGATARTVQSKLRDTVSVKDFGATGDGSTDDTAAIQAALTAAVSAVYFPAGVYKIAGNISFSGKTLDLYGDGPGLSIIRQSTTGGLVFSGSNNGNFSIPNCNVKDIRFEAGAANCGNAITFNMTGGSGFAAVGPRLTNVEIVPQQAGYYWTKGVRGTNVRNAVFDHVTVGSNAITGETTHGFHFDGTDDPVEIWFTNFCYIYVLTTGILVEGTYEGVYLHGINMTTVQDGLKYHPSSVQPVCHVHDSYINCRRAAVDLRDVAYFSISNNGLSSTGIGTGSFYAALIDRSGGLTTASRFSGNTVIGGNGYSGPDTENGVRVVSGSVVDVHDNTFYTLSKGVEFVAGSGLREYDNSYVATTTPVTKPASISTAAQAPEVLLRASANGVAQAVPVNVPTKLDFGAAGSDNYSYFSTANARWTPPAGTYMVFANAYFTTNVADGDILNLSIRRNGSADVIINSYGAVKAGVLAGSVGGVVISTNGTDYFEVFANIEAAAGPDRNKVGTPQLSYWHAFAVT